MAPQLETTTPASLDLESLWWDDQGEQISPEAQLTLIEQEIAKEEAKIQALLQAPQSDPPALLSSIVWDLPPPIEETASQVFEFYGVPPPCEADCPVCDKPFPTDFATTCVVVVIVQVLAALAWLRYCVLSTVRLSTGISCWHMKHDFDLEPSLEAYDQALQVEAACVNHPFMDGFARYYMPGNAPWLAYTTYYNLAEVALVISAIALSYLYRRVLNLSVNVPLVLEKAKAALMANALYTNESTRPGSTFATAKPVKGQFAVAYMNGDVLEVRGFGLRFGSYLVTPKHVLESATPDSMRLLAVKWENGPVVTQVVAADLFTWQHSVTHDLSWAPVESFFTVAKCDSRPLQTAIQVTCHTMFHSQNSSPGVLKPIDEFGLLEYQGSTRPGFSGGVYAVGSAVYGMHQRGGARNEGLSTEFIWYLIKKSQKSSVDEETGDVAYLNLKASRGRLGKMNVRRLLDGYQVSGGGHHNYVDDDEWALVKANFDQLGVQYEYVDAQPATGTPHCNDQVEVIPAPAPSPKPASENCYRPQIHGAALEMDKATIARLTTHALKQTTSSLESILPDMVGPLAQLKLLLPHLTGTLDEVRQLGVALAPQKTTLDRMCSMLSLLQTKFDTMEQALVKIPSPTMPDSTASCTHSTSKDQQVLECSQPTPQSPKLLGSTELGFLKKQLLTCCDFASLPVWNTFTEEQQQGLIRWRQSQQTSKSS